MEPEDDRSFAYQFFEVTWKQMLPNTLATAIGLSLIVLVHGWSEGEVAPLREWPLLFGLLFLVSIVIWGVVTTLNWLVTRSEEGD